MPVATGLPFLLSALPVISWWWGAVPLLLLLSSIPLTGRGIYSNVLGYPGGVAWAIVTARTCQFFPNACPAALLEKFFWFCDRWDWDKPNMQNAIRLRPKIELQLREDMPQFHETQQKDQINWMPIITPTYPDTNATFNVFESTVWVIRKEFARGKKICEAIKAGTAHYPELLERNQFFSKRANPSHKIFIEIIAKAGSKVDLLVFKGVVQSSIRQFIDKVMMGRDGMNPHVVVVPCIRTFDRPTESVQGESEEDDEMVEIHSCSWMLGVTWRNGPVLGGATQRASVIAHFEASRLES
jgi:poly(A) polymerase